MILRNLSLIALICLAVIGLSVLAMALVDHYAPEEATPSPQTPPPPPQQSRVLMNADKAAIRIDNTDALGGLELGGNRLYDQAQANGDSRVLMNDGSFMIIKPGELRHGNVSRCGENKLCGPHGPVTLPYPSFPLPPAPASLETLYQSLLFEQGAQGGDPAVVDLGTIYNVPPGLRSEPLPEGGPASSEWPDGGPSLSVLDAPSNAPGSTITLSKENAPTLFFGTNEKDAALAFYPDGRVLRYGRELGTDVEIFKGLRNLLSGYTCRSSLAEPAKHGEQSVIDLKPSDETGTGIAGPWNSPNFTQ